VPEPAVASLRAAKAGDLAAVRDLLKGAKLHLEGLEKQFGGHYAVLELEGKLIGAMGVEVYGRYGLLRSAVVAPAHRGTGLGVRLTRERIAWADARRIEALFLLTVTAVPFFARLGFAEVPRKSAPAEVQASLEFAKLCGANSVCMRMDLAK
jgi:N-acetylglutamate synthase-like GNAT family acetyltransferase